MVAALMTSSSVHIRAVARAFAALALGQLFLFDIDDGHALADVVAGGFHHRLAAARIEHDVDFGRAFGEAWKRPTAVRRWR